MPVNKAIHGHCLNSAFVPPTIRSPAGVLPHSSGSGKRLNEGCLEGSKFRVICGDFVIISTGGASRAQQTFGALFLKPQIEVFKFLSSSGETQVEPHLFNFAISSSFSAQSFIGTQFSFELHRPENSKICLSHFLTWQELNVY